MKRTITLLFKNDVSCSNVPKRQWIGISNPIFVMFSVLLISLTFSSSAFAQKSAIVEQAEAQLIVVNEKIAEIDNKISAINARIAGIPPENVDPAVFVKLNDLQITKDQYTREKISIEAVLSNDDDVQTDSYSFPAIEHDQLIDSNK